MAWHLLLELIFCLPRSAALHLLLTDRVCVEHLVDHLLLHLRASVLIALHLLRLSLPWRLLLHLLLSDHLTLTYFLAYRSHMLLFNCWTVNYLWQRRVAVSLIYSPLFYHVVPSPHVFVAQRGHDSLRSFLDNLGSDCFQGISFNLEVLQTPVETQKWRQIGDRVVYKAKVRQGRHKMNKCDGHFADLVVSHV